MRQLLLFFVGTFTLTTALIAQDQKPSTCDLQTLAIEAALGDVTAQYNLAVEFHTGKTIPMDLASAAVLWKKAADAGSIEAMNNLGHLTYYGRGIKQDFAGGIALWRRAAMKGMAESQFHLARAYYDRKFLKPDAIESYAWAATAELSVKVMEDAELAAGIKGMIDKLLAELLPNLTPTQRKIAEKRAQSYFSVYGTKKND